MPPDFKRLKVKLHRCGEGCSSYRPDKKPSPIGVVVVDAWCHHPSFEHPRRCGLGDGFPVWCPLDDWRPELKVVKGGQGDD